jgi:hypothetical protein
MTAAEAMKSIEGDRFSALVNLASGLRTFLRIAADQPEVRSLSGEMQAPEVTARVFERVLELSSAPAQQGCEHPADAAIAVYLWLLGSRDGDYAEFAAETVIGCNHFWWARKVAEGVKKSSRFHSVGGAVHKVFHAGGVPIDFTAHALEAVFPVAAFVPACDRVNGVRAQPQGVWGTIVPAGAGDPRSPFRNSGARNQIAEVLGKG